METSRPARHSSFASQLSWQRVFFVGLALWILSILVTGLTGNLNMIPTVVFLGSFLIPVRAVVWYLDHYWSPNVTPLTVFSALFVGGVLGVLAASILESWLLSDGLLVYLGVGLIEEAAKLVALVVVAWGLRGYTTRDGIVLGAAVGFGFAALENSGYAFNSMIVREGHTIAISLPNLMYTELLRGVLAPVGHGAWTAILGGVLFGASRGGRFRVTGSVIGAYLLVSLLHGLWDSMRGIALILTALLTATSPQQIAPDYGVLSPPTPEQVSTFVTFQFVGLAIIALISIMWLWRVWHEGGRELPLEEPMDDSMRRAA